MKKVTSLVKGVINKAKTKTFAVMTAVAAVMAVAPQAHAENADLVTATNSLTTGVTDMKTQALVVIAAVILVIITVFGIAWLVNIAKRMLSKA